jgi:hypothetical protein
VCHAVRDQGRLKGALLLGPSGTRGANHETIGWQMDAGPVGRATRRLGDDHGGLLGAFGPHGRPWALRPGEHREVPAPNDDGRVGTTGVDTE